MNDALSEDELKKILLYAAALCVRSEQCESDIRRKLRLRGLAEGESDRVVEYLYAHRYLDERRYARAFVRTKSRLSGWGPWKIRQALSMRGIDRDVIADAMEECEAADFDEKALQAARRKARNLDLSDRGHRTRIYRFLSARGYGGDTVARVMKALGAEAADDCMPDDTSLC